LLLARLSKISCTSQQSRIRAGTGRHNKNIVSRCYLYLHLQSIRITLTLGTAPWKFETIQLQHLHNYSSNKNTIWIIWIFNPEKSITASSFSLYYIIVYIYINHTYYSII
jgi:hypothetical protein